MTNGGDYMKKVAVIFNGGTISMKVDPRLKAAIPALSSQEIMSMVTGIERFADIEIINFSKLPGPHLTPEIMMDLARLVQSTLERQDIDGVVVTHGTDTLEETAYLLDLTIDNSKPVVVVGAMRNSSELGYDGPSNLAAAICTVISEDARNKGVLVVMNNEVNAASEVTKTHTLSLDTFKSPEFGPLGIVDNDEVIFYRNITKIHHIKVDHIESRVDLIKCGVGMDSRLIRYCVDSGAKGLVIEAMGRGNIPPMMVEGIEHAINNNVAVVLVSRCPMGRVLDTYGYPGAGKNLRDIGVIFGGNLPGQKARIKLMAALGSTFDILEVKKIFELGLYNNIE
jgi:L-asparaginase